MTSPLCEQWPTVMANLFARRAPPQKCNFVFVIIENCHGASSGFATVPPSVLGLIFGLNCS